MRKLSIVLTVFVAVLILNFSAPSKASAGVSVSVDPIFTVVNLLWGAIGVTGSAEFTLGGPLSVYVPVTFLSWSGYGYNWTYIGFGVQAHYFIADAGFNFFKGNPFGGLWVGAGVGLQLWSGGWTGYSWNYMVLDIPIRAGYQWFFAGNTGFYLEPHVGYDIAIGLGTSSWGSLYSPSIGGVLYGVNLGYAF
ncbi:MAG: hypothetical protein A2Y33_15625 [Spirochaetes bacterium GWF1_51_8]|nr:MAG: hypothetical protein A2Y33_15625 [Spirochaetes bacterium GWF1_51_8]